MGYVQQFCTEGDSGMKWVMEHQVEIVAAILAAGWIVDNILAEVPTIAANSTFQLCKGILDKITRRISK